MNRTLRKCCAALLAILAVYAAPAAEKTVYLKDFLAPGAAGTDAVPAVRAALEHCAEVGASRLVLPGGQLRMRPDRAVEKYQFISNNDESLKRIAFDLVGMRDFEIDGNGTELLFTGFISPFSLEDCENITVRDLTIDFTRTFNSEGTVVAKGDGWLEIEFPEDYLATSSTAACVSAMPRVRCTPSPTCWSSTPCGANRRSVPRTTGCRTGRSRPKNAPTATSAFCAKT